MITPFTVYLVLQMDAIITASQIIGAFCTIITAILYAIQALLYDDKGVQDALTKLPRKLIAWLAIIFVPVSVLLPKSSTLAAMLIAPAIANSEVVQKDVPELYNLAVEALKQKLGGGK